MPLPLPRPRPLAWPAALVLGLVAASQGACDRADHPPPMATMAVSIDQNHAIAGGPLHLSYAFTLAPGADLVADFAVFVHGIDGRGSRVWADDHEPPVPTSGWKPGEPVRYTRTTFLPVVSYLGPMTIEAGLYRDGARLPLQVTRVPVDQRRDSLRAYQIGTIEVLPQSAGTLVSFGEGWYDQEFDSVDPTLSWRWTRSAAEVTFDNPRQPVDLYLEYDVPGRLLPDPQQVIVRLLGRTVAAFDAVPETPSGHRIPLSAAQLGEDERVALRLEVFPAFVPAELTSSADMRELGVRVRHLHIQPDRPAPSAADPKEREGGPVDPGGAMK